MKAAYFDKYNKIAELKLGDFPIPEVGEEDVLVKILYAAVNPVDIMTIHGEIKLITPKKGKQIAGNEMVGIVEKIGDKVTRFRVGDRVFGRLTIDKTGGFAEYVSVNEDILAKVPKSFTTEEAATIPLATLTIVQALKLMDPKPGSTIFISGGTGSLGMIAIPIAKAYGLNVITSGNVKNKDQVLKLGVSKFFDYKTEDYSKELKDVDYVLDTVGEKELNKEFSILKPGGHLVSLKGLPNGDFAKRMGLPLYKQILFKIAGSKYDNLAKKNGSKYDFVFVQPNGKELEEAVKILENNDVHPLIDKIYDLKHINDALKKVENGSPKGKTLIRIGAKED